MYENASSMFVIAAFVNKGVLSLLGNTIFATYAYAIVATLVAPFIEEILKKTISGKASFYATAVFVAVETISYCIGHNAVLWVRFFVTHPMHLSSVKMPWWAAILFHSGFNAIALAGMPLFAVATYVAIGTYLAFRMSK